VTTFPAPHLSVAPFSSPPRFVAALAEAAAGTSGRRHPHLTADVPTSSVEARERLVLGSTSSTPIVSEDTDGPDPDEVGHDLSARRPRRDVLTVQRRSVWFGGAVALQAG
jgi:hypothetical protein